MFKSSLTVRLMIRCSLNILASPKKWVYKEVLHRPPIKSLNNLELVYPLTYLRGEADACLWRGEDGVGDDGDLDLSFSKGDASAGDLDLSFDGGDAGTGDLDLSFFALSSRLDDAVELDLDFDLDFDNDFDLDLDLALVEEAASSSEDEDELEELSSVDLSSSSSLLDELEASLSSSASLLLEDSTSELSSSSSDSLPASSSLSLTTALDVARSFFLSVGSRVAGGLGSSLGDPLRRCLSFFFFFLFSGEISSCWAEDCSGTFFLVVSVFFLEYLGIAPRNPNPSKENMIN